jgi:uncharacterized membrane protein
VLNVDTRRAALGPIVFGIGVAGTLDEIVLHQILHWHHLYDRSTPGVALVSDGLLHIGSTAALLFGGRAILRLRHETGTSAGRQIAAGIMIGAGGFNLYDGSVQHKVFRLHQVRYGVDPLPYDAAFIGFAAVVFLVGLGLWFRPARRARPEGIRTKGRA